MLPVPLTFINNNAAYVKIGTAQLKSDSNTTLIPFDITVHVLNIVKV